MKHLTHIGVLTGLAIGFMLCHVSPPKPAQISRTEPTGLQVPLKPTWIPLAPIVTDSPISSSPQITPPIIESVSVEPQSTTHTDLMAQAGISPSDYGAVEYIVSHESSWDQSATEPNTQAHGLVQALPFSKTGCSWDDAVCTLAWGQKYADSRYNGWWGAYNYWIVNHNW